MVDHLSEQYADAILTSDPAQRDEREHNYHLHHALQHLVQQLGAYAAAAQELIQEGQREDEQGQQDEDE